MSLNISSIAISALNTNIWQQKQQDLSQLSLALNAGNLPNAQQAFSALTNNSTNISNPTDSSSSTTPTDNTNGNTPAAPGSPMDALSAALVAGDLAAAQKAFSALPTSFIHPLNQVKATDYAEKNTSSIAQQQPLSTSGRIGTNINTNV